MSPALYLADTSGLFRLLQAKTGEAWDEQLAAGVIATCPVVELEFLYLARSLADRLEKQRLFQRLFTWVPMPDDAYARACEIQQRLTETGHHRSAGPVDLLISVTTERHRLTILTDDRGFLTVAAVTGPLRFASSPARTDHAPAPPRSCTACPSRAPLPTRPDKEARQR